jgi:hypothetical protein
MDGDRESEKIARGELGNVLDLPPAQSKRVKGALSVHATTKANEQDQRRIG